MSLFPLGLISQGGGAGAGGNALELISTTVLTGTATSVSFSSIVGTYKHLQLRVAASTTSNGFRLAMTVNGVTSGYARHSLTGDGSVISSDARTSRASMEIGSTSYGTMYTTPSAAIVDILDYANTSKNKTIRGLYGAAHTSAREITLTSGLYAATTAITSLSVDATSGTFAIGSRFSLYGVL